MKFLSFSIMAAALISLASCSKQTDTKVSDSPATNLGPNGGGANWTGTAPLSAKLNGRTFQATTGTAATANGVIVVQGTDEVSMAAVGITFPANAAPGSFYNSPSISATIFYAEPLTLTTFIPYNGGVKITINNATTAEGYFYGDMRNPNAVGSADTVISLKEGYFKVTKQ